MVFFLTSSRPSPLFSPGALGRCETERCQHNCMSEAVEAGGPWHCMGHLHSKHQCLCVGHLLLLWLHAPGETVFRDPKSNFVKYQNFNQWILDDRMMIEQYAVTLKDHFIWFHTELSPSYLSMARTLSPQDLQQSSRDVNATKNPLLNEAKLLALPVVVSLINLLLPGLFNLAAWMEEYESPSVSTYVAIGRYDQRTGQRSKCLCVKVQNM